MSKSVHETDLWLGRAALTKQLITGPQLTKALLLQSKTGNKKPLELVFKEEGILNYHRIEELKKDLVGTPTLKHEIPVDDTEAKARVGKIFLKVLCDGLLECDRFTASYLGRLPRDPKPVQLKLISKEALRHGLWMDFLETVRACKGIQVRNLVEVIDVGMVEKAFAIVTRHHKGGLTLRQLLGRVRRLKLSEALRITRELAQGLAALHAAGLAHRDLKPENVLLGTRGEVQIMNAGIVFEPEGAEEFASRATVFGSMHSIAPECLRGDPPDPLSDVYGLGIIAYELATGVRPFEGERLSDLRKQHLEDEPIPPHKVMGALPKEIGELLVWMLAKKSKDRPSAPKLVSTLQSLEKTIKRTGHTQKFQAFDPNG